MAETPDNPADPTSPVSPEDPTIPRPARLGTLADSGGSDFKHGRFVPGQMLGERYRIVAMLGAGGMGEVYRADDLELGQSVALKFLPEKVAADDAWLRRFRNEVRTARQVAHPNLCRIYDIGQEDGHVFLSMEYIDGEDLGGVLRRMGRPSREKAIEIARQICLGLAAAHEANVLHRDLKPQNIMIDGRGKVRITDFGLAGFLDELEHTEARAGTPAYMAPEQLAHGKVSVRSDIYSLGLILHELFTGQSVFDTDDVEEIKRQHTSGSVSRPSTTTDDIDPVIERLIARCLEPKPEDRPQSVYQVLAALPGGDPLAAALAAGETPSPELVANARDAGGLGPKYAIGLFAALVVSVTFVYMLTMTSIIMPEQPPNRLSVVAEQVLEDLGYTDLPRYSVSGYDVNLAQFMSLRENPATADQLRQRTWPPKYRYWRRWSNADIQPTDSHFPEQMMVDAPTDQPESTLTVALDSTGKLLALSIPPAMVKTPSSVPAQIDWSPLFKFAVFDPSDAKQVKPENAPTVFCDTIVAWQFERLTEDSDPVTVLTGAYAGLPIYFEIVGLGQDMMPNHMMFRANAGVRDYVWFILLLVMIFLAHRNVRAGRADRRSAFKCAIFVAALYALLEVLAITVGGSEPVTRVIDLTANRAAGHIVVHGITIWVYYLAIEPYVRRMYPRMLIGLLRVVSGRLRDPAVGRELLIGLAIACSFVLVLTLVAAADWYVAADNSARLASPMPLRAILSPAHYLSNQAHFIAWAVLSGFTVASIVILVRVLVRHAFISTGLSVVIIAFQFMIRYFMHGGDSLLALIIYAIAIGVCLVWLLTRVGVLSAIVFEFVILSSGLFGLAFDAWSTPYLLGWLATLLALAAYGFWVSLAGQPIFKDMLAEPNAS